MKYKSQRCIKQEATRVYNRSECRDSVIATTTTITIVIATTTMITIWKSIWVIKNGSGRLIRNSGRE